MNSNSCFCTRCHSSEFNHLRQEKSAKILHCGLCTRYHFVDFSRISKIKRAESHDLMLLHTLSNSNTRFPPGWKAGFTDIYANVANGALEGKEKHRLPKIPLTETRLPLWHLVRQQCGHGTGTAKSLAAYFSLMSLFTSATVLLIGPSASILRLVAAAAQTVASRAVPVRRLHA